ncbi:hypothetical protein ACA910_012742 [Epithemia clementina (nom. ined.)]
MSTDLLIQKRRDRRKQKQGGGGQRQAKSTTISSAPPGAVTRSEKTSQQQQQGRRRKRDAAAAATTTAVKVATTKSSPQQRDKNFKVQKEENDPYAHLDSATALALRNEDAEIAALEAKLGLTSDQRDKKKKRLNQEYAKHEGYGDDFGDFLDDLDHMVKRLHHRHQTSTDDDDDDKNRMSENKTRHHQSTTNEGGQDSAGSSSSSNDEEEEGKVENNSLDVEKDSDSDDTESSRDGHSDSDRDETVPMAKPATKVLGSNDDDDDDDRGKDDLSDDDESLQDSADQVSAKDTYRPAEGEDIYGHVLDDKGDDSVKKTKYIPPHLRAAAARDVNDENNTKTKESRAAIQRSLNNSLNRLSEDTLCTVAQSMAQLYSSHATGNVNDCIWENCNQACLLARSFLMTGLIPLYAAALVGVHIQKGDAAHLGEFIIERAVTEFDKELQRERATTQDETKDGESNTPNDESMPTDKRVFNLMLLLCYLYNFDIVHCSLIYDVIRDLIISFQEVDIELLLIILSHVGRSLRSDDPSALKAIVLDVQKRAYENEISKNSSRVAYLVSAVVDLKNNKRRKQDTVFGEKTTQLRKLIGRIKSVVASNTGNVRSSDASLRIRLNDILQAEGKGRWWRVGAAWEGNQHTSVVGSNSDVTQSSAEKPRSASSLSQMEEEDKESKLLQLAAKYRMNTDTRRSIFCIIMGSADFEDAFEKLVRAGMLKNKSERETARVLMENCGNEKAYNQFYAHLAKRICEYQSQAKFTFQLAFWDSFKQLESMKPRKAANLAKLLFALIVEHRVLKLHVLKGIDMTSPDDLSETGMIFLTVFFTKLMEYFDDPSDVTIFFESGVNAQQKRQTTEESDLLVGPSQETEALYGSLSLFFVQVLKSSPKYAKGTKFRANLKAAIKACDTGNFFFKTTHCRLPRTPLRS